MISDYDLGILSDFNRAKGEKFDISSTATNSSISPVNFSRSRRKDSPCSWYYYPVPREILKKRSSHNNHMQNNSSSGNCGNACGSECHSNNCRTNNYTCPPYPNISHHHNSINNNHKNPNSGNNNNNNNSSSSSSNIQTPFITPHYIPNNSHVPHPHVTPGSPSSSNKVPKYSFHFSQHNSASSNRLSPSCGGDPVSLSRKHSIISNISKFSIAGSIKRAFSAASISEAPPRLVDSTGRRNIGIINVPFSTRQLNNAFRYMVNVHWALQMAVIASVFFMSWSVFGLLWWTLHNTQGRIIGEEQCLANVDSFYSALLFSLETQTTIGFGHRFVNSSCHSAVMLLWVQMMVSMVLDSTMIAIILSKITHPKWRQSTIYFSDSLCIFKREDEYVLSLRVADMSTGSMPEAHVRMYLVHSTTDTHGNNCLLMEDLDVGYDCGRDRLILLVPWIIEHRIDAESPLFKKSWHDIQSVHFEVIVLLEGAVEETGSTAQVIQSYTASDIKWGYNFASMLTRKGNKYLSDFDKLNSVIALPDMPTCSLYELLGDEEMSESEAPTMMRKRAFSTIYDIPPTLTEMENEDC